MYHTSHLPLYLHLELKDREHKVHFSCLCRFIVIQLMLRLSLINNICTIFLITTALFHRISGFQQYAINCIASPQLHTVRTVKHMSKRKSSSVDPLKAATKKSQRSSVTVENVTVLPKLPFIPSGFNAARARLLSDTADLRTDGDCVILWMSRDQRVNDNHAMLYAQGVATANNVPLKVIFNMVPKFLEATLRQYDFMVKGLMEVEEQLRKKHIPFHLLMGNPVVNIPQFASEHRAILVVVDFSPLRIGLLWSKSAGDGLDDLQIPIPLVQVDAHNVVPCWVASPKLEYGARTIRTKIQNRLPEFLTNFEELAPNKHGSLAGCQSIDWAAALGSLEINRTVAPVSWLQPGSSAALGVLQSFIETRLKDYGTKRNDPNQDLQSNLSPYIHFGQISVQRLVLAVKSSKKHPSSADSFIEEAVVRSELADNFCFCKFQCSFSDSFIPFH
jgi:deoxyribodipyrimidine photo-lyase